MGANSLIVRGPAPLAERLILQYDDHPDWSYQLHYDNLAALVKAEPVQFTMDDVRRIIIPEQMQRGFEQMCLNTAAESDLRK